MLRKILTLVLALVLALGCTAFADDLPDYPYTEENIAKAKEWYATFDTTGKTYDKNVTIQLAFQHASDGKNYAEDDVLTKFYQEHFNVTYDLIPLPASDTDAKVRTMINSDDMPDILNWSTFNALEFMNYVDQGYLYEWPEDWRERWPNIARMQDLVPEAELFREKTGGQYIAFRTTFYNAISQFGGTVIPEHTGVFLNKTWADAVGYELKDAMSYADVVEYARLIKAQDPGKLGENLVPISVSTDNAAYLFIYSSFPSWKSIYNDNGTYAWGFADERTLAGLTALQDAYREGLVDVEFFTKSEEDSRLAFAVTGTGASHSGGGSAGLIGDMYEGMADRSCEMWVAALVAKDGYYRGNALGNYWGATTFSADISDEAFERYMDMMNFNAIAAVQDVTYTGFRYLDWDYNEDGTKYPLYDTEAYKTWAAVSTAWPMYHLMAGCGDDATLTRVLVDPTEKDIFSTAGTLKIYETKLKRLTDDSVVPFDTLAYLFSSDNQNMLSNIDYNTIVANLIVSEGDIAENWKAIIAEYAYIVDPAVAELNAAFGTTK